MAFFYLKALHIIFVVTWFAGLFYIIRLFIYFVEAEEKPEPDKTILQKQFQIMQTRLWYGITWPSMILTVILGGWVLYEKPVDLYQPWMWFKLGMVGGLILYHLYCGSIYLQLRKGIVKHSSMKLRILNEVATIFLFVIVFIVVVGSVSMLDWVWGVCGTLMLMVILYLGIMLYKKSRKGKD